MKYCFVFTITLLLGCNSKNQSIQIYKEWECSSLINGVATIEFDTLDFDQEGIIINDKIIDKNAFDQKLISLNKLQSVDTVIRVSDIDFEVVAIKSYLYENDSVRVYKIIKSHDMDLMPFLYTVEFGEMMKISRRNLYKLKSIKYKNSSLKLEFKEFINKLESDTTLNFTLPISMKLSD